MGKTLFIKFLPIIILAGFVCAAGAADGPSSRLGRVPAVKVTNDEMKKIDTNNDGVLDLKEQRKVWGCISHPLGHPSQKKYDINKNDVLEPEESRMCLKDKYKAAKSEGKIPVETFMDKFYDTNDDGFIDADEADVIAEDIK